jgi:GT2 family glycosyltransferase
MFPNNYHTYKVSVCICTRNRPENLQKALDSLTKSTYPIFETIVSDDSTNTETEELVKSKYPHVKFMVGPKVGLGANRNNALRTVQGSHVLFIDDDVVLGEKFLETVVDYVNKHIKETGEDADKIIVTGPQLDHGELTFPHEQDFLGFQKIDYKEGDIIKTVVINSAIFPASVFQEVLFDTKLVYGCDEVDFTTRAVKQGYSIHLCSEAVNYHFPSHINRDFYTPYHEASRIYVTFKRYFSTDANKLKAMLFLGIAPLHTAFHSLSSEGLKGLEKLLETFRLVYNYITLEYPLFWK